MCLKHNSKTTPTQNSTKRATHRECALCTVHCAVCALCTAQCNVSSSLRAAAAPLPHEHRRARATSFEGLRSSAPCGASQLAHAQRTCVYTVTNKEPTHTAVQLPLKRSVHRIAKKASFFLLLPLKSTRLHLLWSPRARLLL